MANTNSKLALFLKVLFGGICLSMIVVAVVTSLKSNLWEVGPSILSEPWNVATLIDFYFNILIISVWVVYKENNILKSILWIVAFVILGSIATSFYVLTQLFRLKPEESLSNLLLRRN